MELVHRDIDRYLAEFSASGDPLLEEMERLAEAQRFPIVGPQVGRLLELLARTCAARRVLELGSGFGYSAYWFLRALPPGGEIVLTEGSPDRAAQAATFLARGGFAARHRVEVGDAFAAAARETGPFDVVFNDVDKHAYAATLGIAERLVRPGGLFISDNMLWSGKVCRPAAQDRDTAGVVALTDALRRSRDFACALLPVRDGVLAATRL
jgi:predicted O-methyltransferase YrrM